MTDEHNPSQDEIYEKIWEIHHGLGNVCNYLYLFEDLTLLILQDCSDKSMEADLHQLKRIHERVLDDINLIKEDIRKILRVRFPEIDNLHQD